MRDKVLPYDLPSWSVASIRTFELSNSGLFDVQRTKNFDFLESWCYFRRINETIIQRNLHL